MIAKVCHNRSRFDARGPRCGCPFGGRINYICRKAVDIQCVNLSGTWQEARAQMRVTRGLNGAVQHPAAHIVLSWHKTEKPSDSAMISAARLVMIDFGAALHQMVIAVHRDRPNPHVHIVLNRVHPVAGKALPLWQDYLRLERACRRVEARMGWAADRGRFDTIPDALPPTLVPKPRTHWQAKTRNRALGLRPTPEADRALERRSGLPALIDMLAPKVQIWLRQRLTSAANWQEAHDALRRYDLRYVLHRNGARILHRTSAWRMAASRLGANCGLWAMQHRLGGFVPDRGAGGLTTVLAGPAEPQFGPAELALLTLTAKLLQPIRDKREAHERACLMARQAWQQLHQAQTEETAAVRQTLRGNKSPMAQALRHVMRAQHKATRERLRSATPGVQWGAIHLLDAIAQAHPQEAERRRYRDVLRRTALLDATGTTDDAPSDMTAARQAWFTAPMRSQDTKLPSALHDAIAGYAGDMRADGEGRLLMPRRRQDDTIAGFAWLDLTKPAGRNRASQYGAQGGLILIGPRDAKRCIIVSDSLTALATAVRLRDQPVLIIAVGDHIRQAEATHIQSLTERRDTTIANKSDEEQSSLMTHLAGLLPSASLVQWEGERQSPIKPYMQQVYLHRDTLKGPHPKDPD